jgi:hypothetical protein
MLLASGLVVTKRNIVACGEVGVINIENGRDRSREEEMKTR